MELGENVVSGLLGLVSVISYLLPSMETRIELKLTVEEKCL